MNKQNVEKEQMGLGERFCAVFGNNPCIGVEVIEVEGIVYYITSGTGEGVFAYDEGEFEYGIDFAEQAKEEKYQEFCDHAEAVCNKPKIAKAIYERLGVQLSNPGACEPMRMEG